MNKWRQKKREEAESLNNYFIEAMQNLDIEKFNSNSEQEIQTGNTDEVIEKILEKYKTHPSILKLKENVKVDNKFKFDNTTEDDVCLKIKSLDPKTTTCTENDIPAKTLIGTKDIVSGYLFNVYNDSKKSETYPSSLKNADVTPIHKEKENSLKKHYRPVSILPILSKLYEGTMNEQMTSHIEKYLRTSLDTGRGTEHNIVC